MSEIPPRRYRLLVRALAPLILVHLLWRARKDGGWRYVIERLGLGDARADQDDKREPARPLWIHAASVGEILTVLPLIDARIKIAPNAPILVTSNTPTGAEVLKSHAPPGVRHGYLPVDWPGATERFLVRERPTAGWIVETEIWPWLYYQASRHGVPMTIINARLSTRTLSRSGGWVGRAYAAALDGVRVLARSEKDAMAWQQIGADSEAIDVVGELKFAVRASSDEHRRSPPIEHAFVLAASTHDDEEVQLGEAWLAGTDTGLLVIAPRHPERAEKILKAWRARFPALSCARRSLGERPEPTDRLHLADTLGELDLWFSHAAACFVGGSLIPRGGHNVLEPARRSCPIIVGPHTENFADAVRILRDAGGIALADDVTAIVDFLHVALDGSKAMTVQAERARSVATGLAGMAERYLCLLDEA